MLRLSTFYMLLALAVAQNGYEYDKPRRPFQSSSSRPGFPSGPSGGYPTTISYHGGPQNNDYSDSSTPGYPSGPSGPNQGFPGPSSQRPSGFPGQSYPGQGPSAPNGYPEQNGQSQSGRGPSGSYPGQGPSGPDGYPGQNGPLQPGRGPNGQNSRYPGGSGFGPDSGSPGFSPLSNGYQPGSSGFGGSEDTGEYEGGDYSAIPGQPDIDYPILSYIPSTSFSCDAQAYPGYYADVETRCQVFHVCANNKTYDFICPNGTIFSQEVFVCVWWDQFDCNSAPSLYGLNANLYDYSIIGSQGSQGPSYSGGRPQGSDFPGSSGLQGPSSYPGISGQKGPSTSYSGSSGPQSPSGFPGSNGPQGPSGSYPGSLRPSSDYPGSSYPGSTGPQGPSGTGSYPTSTPYPGSSGPQGPSGGPGSYQGTGPGSSYPGSGPSNYPGSSGYPSGKPSGPGFPNGDGRPAQKPNREYLPPN